ncbi:hypothetical protein HanOQP8_Chr09g0309621 [Helianthus annuus]|nr:hypothetical protein HanOQP8_Chr09g0309621 [Helianthus annuus]
MFHREKSTQTLNYFLNITFLFQVNPTYHSLIFPQLKDHHYSYLYCLVMNFRGGY